jgi:hypothetical protein
MDHITVSGTASHFDVRPRVISDLFYARVLDGRCCPIVGGRRLIPLDYLPVIAAVLQARRAQGRRPRAEGPEPGR